MSLDALYLVKRLGRQIARATMWATDNRNIFDYQKARAFPVASRRVPRGYCTVVCQSMGEGARCTPAARLALGQLRDPLS